MTDSSFQIVWEKVQLPLFSLHLIVVTFWRQRICQILDMEICYCDDTFDAWRALSSLLSWSWLKMAGWLTLEDPGLSTRLYLKVLKKNESVMLGEGEKKCIELWNCSWNTPWLQLPPLWNWNRRDIPKIWFKRKCVLCLRWLNLKRRKNFIWEYPYYS